jgi:hypothetical protein
VGRCESSGCSLGTGEFFSDVRSRADTDSASQFKTLNPKASSADAFGRGVAFRVIRCLSQGGHPPQRNEEGLGVPALCRDGEASAVLVKLSKSEVQSQDFHGFRSRGLLKTSWLSGARREALAQRATRRHVLAALHALQRRLQQDPSSLALLSTAYG